MNPMLTALLEFNQSFEIPKLDAPGLGPEDLAALRVKLLREEVEEYAQALADGDLVEVLDALAVTCAGHGFHTDDAPYDRVQFQKVRIQRVLSRQFFYNSCTQI